MSTERMISSLLHGLLIWTTYVDEPCADYAASRPQEY